MVSHERILSSHKLWASVGQITIALVVDGGMKIKHSAKINYIFLKWELEAHPPHTFGGINRYLDIKKDGDGGLIAGFFFWSNLSTGVS